MTIYEKERMLASLMGADPDTDGELLKTHLNMAKSVILGLRYPFQDTSGMEVEDQYTMIQLRMAMYSLKRRGDEGETAHSENGVSRVYGSADYPPELLSLITPKAVVF